MRFKERLLCRMQGRARWNAAPLAIDRIANTCTRVRSSPRSTQASYQSTWLPGPNRNFAAQTSPAAPDPSGDCARAHGCAPSTRRPWRQGIPPGCGDTADARYAAACAAPARSAARTSSMNATDRAQLRLGAFWVVVLRGQSSGQRLPHHPPVNAELRGHSRYRADAKFMLPTKLLEQIHFGSPVHARPPDPLGRP